MEVSVDMFDLSLSRQKCHVVLSAHRGRSVLRDRDLFPISVHTPSLYHDLKTQNMT